MEPEPFILDVAKGDKYELVKFLRSSFHWLAARQSLPKRQLPVTARLGAAREPWRRPVFARVSTSGELRPLNTSGTLPKFDANSDCREQKHLANHHEGTHRYATQASAPSKRILRHCRIWNVITAEEKAPTRLQAPIASRPSTAYARRRRPSTRRSYKMRTTMPPWFVVRRRGWACGATRRSKRLLMQLATFPSSKGADTRRRGNG
mmetsp:Transcript_101404/g.286060  ORF Transcript_101404/g.286060 Transcript_101404/m.286060 type:complete len:206 (-) Transcript_101404:94-711(-)